MMISLPAAIRSWNWATGYGSVTDRDRIDQVSEFFGDSYRAVSEVDILTFSLGLALGLFLGTLPIPLPGGSELRLGFAGGPLLTALVLGTLGRTGPLVWSLPYSANMTLRQIGLILFLAGVGTRAGYGFINTFTQQGGLLLFGTGIVITCTVAVSMLWVGYRMSQDSHESFDRHACRAANPIGGTWLCARTEPERTADGRVCLCLSGCHHYQDPVGAAAADDADEVKNRMKAEDKEKNISYCFRKEEIL